MVCAVLAAAVGVLAFWSTRDYMLVGDERITFAVQGLYTRSWAQGLFEDANRVGELRVLLPVIIVLAGLLAFRRAFTTAAIVVAAAAMLVVPELVAALVERPAQQYDDMRATFDGLLYPRIYPNPDGFPSGHVFGVTLVTGLVFVFADRALPWRPAPVVAQFLAIVVALLAFTAPMYLGAHWFTDCVGGALLAILVVMLAWRGDRALLGERPLRVADLVEVPAGSSSYGSRADTASRR
jgi:membrane-associated phospholipid phosphatase